MPSTIKKRTTKILELIDKGITLNKAKNRHKLELVNLYNKILEEVSQIEFELTSAYPEAFTTPGPREKLNLKGISLKSLGLSREELKRAISSLKKEERKEIEKEYVLYKPNPFAEIANRFVEPLTLFLLRRFPNFFKPLLKSLRVVNLNMLSRSYISLILFSTMLAFILLIPFLYFFVFHSIVKALLFAFLGSCVTFVVGYFYPNSIINSRKKKIKNELPFAIIHMAAISGSGITPVNIFDMLVRSKEYRELDKELKKLMNYINIFGYNLTTAMRAVASTTPSDEFRELLNGMISTIESGGNLKDYLRQKAEDALSSYKLERKKYLETLATYSDIYTAVMIAAPLLFVTTLAIINVIGGNLAGLSATTIAMIGTFGVIPLLNIGYIIFLTLTQPEL